MCLFNTWTYDSLQVLSEQRLQVLKVQLLEEVEDPFRAKLHAAEAEVESDDKHSLLKPQKKKKNTSVCSFVIIRRRKGQHCTKLAQSNCPVLQIEQLQGELNKLRYEHSFLQQEYQHEKNSHEQVVQEMRLRHEAEVSGLKRDKKEGSGRNENLPSPSTFCVLCRNNAKWYCDDSSPFWNKSQNIPILLSQIASCR